MNYLQKKKIAFMSIVNRVKGFVRTVIGTLPLTLTNCVDKKSVTDYKLYGQSVQNGTPSPDTPIEIESVGEYDSVSGKYKIPVTVSGKNLIPEWKAGWIVAGTGVLNENYSTRRYTDYIPIESGVSYMVSGGGTNSNWTLYDENFKFLSGQIFGSSRHINHSSAKYVRIAHPNTDTSDIQIEKGSTITDYEPYHKPITTNIYLDEPLRKIGKNEDYIDFENGKVLRYVKRKRLTKAGTLYTIGGLVGFYTDFGFLDSNYLRTTGLSNREKTFTEIPKDSTTIWLGVNNSIVYWIGILSKLGFTTLTQMNNWLSENETWIYWVSKTPTETPITLPNLPTFKGTSVVSVDTTIQPSNAEIEYFSNIKE